MPNPKLETYKNKATGDVYDFTDADAQGKLTAILDGTDIDSFSDVESALADKVDVVSGKGLSTNDYDDTEKAKVAGAFPRSEQAVLGATNMFDIDAPIVTASQNTTYTIASSKTGSSLRVTNSVAGAGKWAYYTGFSLPQNTDIIATFGLTYTSGKAKLIVDGSTDGTNWTEIKQSNSITENGDYSLSFNTGNYTKFRARFYCTVDTSETGDVTYTNIVFKLASDTDTTFAPYAMTNRELTDNVASRVIFKTLSGGDLDDILTTGWYSWGGTAPTHSPQGVAYSCMQCIVETGVQKQIVYFGADVIYMRQRSGSPATWGSWYKFQGTIVS